VKILLDTCTLIWAVSDPEKLTVAVRKALTDPNTVVWFSPITCAEIACLSDRGRIFLKMSWKKWFNMYVEQNGWQAADINLAIVQDAFSLPGPFHADPADRIIVATARNHQLFLATADQKILDYPFVDTLWN
jgi:PIN domain nuclease of toxin-antitoxin system